METERRGDGYLFQESPTFSEEDSAGDPRHGGGFQGEETVGIVPQSWGADWGFAKKGELRCKPPGDWHICGA